MSVILALLAALFAAFTAILAKIGIENVNSNLATAIRTVVVLIMAFLIVLYTGELNNLETITGKSFLLIILSGFATGFSWLFFFKAISIGDVSKVVPIDKSSVVLTIIISLTFLGEPLAPFVIIGGSLVAIGTFVLIGKSDQKESFTGSRVYILYALLSAFFASMTAILAKLGMSDVDSNLATFLRTIVILLFSWGIVFFQGGHKQLPSISKRSYLFLILSGAATGFSWLFYFAALALGNVSVVAPIDKFSVVIVMLLSSFILKEKLTRQTIMGGLIITLGTVFLVLPRING